MENEYCVSCGNESEMPRCKDCFMAHCKDRTHLRQRIGAVGTVRVTESEIVGGAPAKYCRYCGEDIDNERLKFALRRGGECLTCYSCSHS